MLSRLICTDDDIARFLARFTVALVIFPHGAQKLFGWFGGKGVPETIEFFTNWGFPLPLVVLLIFTESIGALLLAAGFLARIWAAGMTVIMIVAMWKAHFRWGFFMNWYAERRGEGFEYHLLVLGLSLITIVTGAGKWSVDRWLYRRLSSPS